MQVVPNTAGQWKSGLCECCSTPGCCTACCCPCCIYGEIAAKLSPQEAKCGGSYGGACCCYYSLHALSQLIDAAFVLAFCIPVGTIALPFSTIIHCPARSAIRRKYNIPGSDCEDCMVVWCCMCCALAQVLSSTHVLAYIKLYLMNADICVRDRPMPSPSPWFRCVAALAGD